MSQFVRLTVIVCVLMLGAIPVAAQSTSGSISGTATDESRAVMPGVTITVANVETGISRSVVTDAQGRYRVLGLVPGTYRVTAELQGFARVTRDGVTVAIGADVPNDVLMKVGGVNETVTVAADETTLDLSSSVVGGVVTTKQIAELPLNGRSFMQLATLQPGVNISRATERDFGGGYGGTQVTIAGARPEQTGYLMDGTNIADIGDKAPSSVAGVMLGVDTVQEFSVQTHGYSAEFGRAAGGVISAVTKSGTNAFRGTVFEFHRNSALDEKNYFDQGDEPPDFKRNQFGGTLGGPIVRNRLFFFGSYEGLRERLATTRIARMPNANSRAGLLPAASGGGLRQVAVHPAIRPYLDLLYPLPNGRDFGDGTGELLHAPTEPTDQDFFVGKLDWNPSDQDGFMVRFSSDTSRNQLWEEHPDFTDVNTTETRYVTTQWQRIVSSSIVNQLRGAFNRTAREIKPTPLIDIPESLFFLPDMFGAIEMPGVLTLTGNFNDPAQYNQNLIQVSDTLTINTSRHTWKTGFDYQHYNFYGFSHSRLGGTFRFRSLEEMLTLRRSSSAQADRFLGNLPGTDTFRDMSQHYTSLFIHDDFRLSDRLSLSLGLRYEFVTVPEEKDGKVAGLLSLDDLNREPFGVTPGSPLFDNPSKSAGFAPRFGFSWKPFADNRTTIKGGAGMFHQPLTVSFYRGTSFRQYPYFAGVDLRQPARFGPEIQTILAGGVGSAVQKRSEWIYHDVDQPYSLQWYLNSQHELGGGFVAEVGYLGSHGENLPYYGDPNSRPTEYLPDGTKRVVPGTTIRYPAWGRIRTRRTGAESDYHGMTLGLQKRLQHGLQFQANYTLSKSTDTWSGGLQGSSDYLTGSGSAVDWWDIEFERGRSSFDVPHNFVFNAVYALPFGAKLTGFAGALASGWQISGIVNLSSGLPFHPVIGFDRAGDGQSDTDMQRPSWAPGRNPGNAITGNPEQWVDPEAFVLPAAGTFGDVRRNSLRGPDTRVVDLSVFKNQAIGRSVLQFRIEIFNLFNRANFAPPSEVVLFSSNGSRVAGAGNITSLVTPSRQVQLGVKLIF